MKMFYKATLRRTTGTRAGGSFETYGFLPDLLEATKSGDYELADYEPDVDYVKDQGISLPAEKDLTQLIDLSLATHDEAWFKELVGRQKGLPV